MCARCASVCCALVYWCAGVSAVCILPHFSLNLSYSGSWKSKVNHVQLQDRPWHLSIHNTTSLANGDKMFSITIELKAPALGNDCRPDQVKKYYKVHSDKMAWPDALDACAEEDGHLAVLDSEEEAEDLIEMIVKAETTRWVHWIGFHDHFKEGYYVSVFNQKLKYSGWAPGEPSGNPSLNCGFFYFTNATNYGMADGNCNQLYRFICERSTPALGYEHARRDKNYSASQEQEFSANQEKNASKIQENNPSADEENANASQNVTSDEGKKTFANMGNAQSDSQLKNQSVTLDGNPTPSNEENQSGKNLSENLGKNDSKSQGSNQSANSENAPPTDQVQDQSARDAKDPTANWQQNPDTGYVYVPELGHYKLHNISQRRSWHEAYAICAREGSHLLILNSEQEEEVIKVLIEISRTSGRLHWVGFHDQYKERKYITVCNKTLEYAKWYPGRPEGSKQLNCGYYLYHNTTHSGLADGDCTWSGPFICEDESLEKRPALPQSGYLKAPGRLGYYKKYKEVKNFQDAMHACAADGSHLIIINNDLEERVMMTVAGKGSHWVGIHDSYSEGKYVTLFNETLKSTGYSRWYPGDPNDVEWIEEDCIVFTYQSKSRRGLADLNCDLKHPFVCEFELDKCPHKS